ncbi:MAG: Fic family protein [Candidatus Bathyarchaeia archaeon]|jgi:prophage maintenance system killer protein
MVWYPTPEDIILLNRLALEESLDKHPVKLLGRRDGLQSMIEKIKRAERKGLTFQAARFMKDILLLHAFDGGNHRTAYITAYNFLKMNDKKVRVVKKTIAEPFVKSIPEKSYEQLQEWIVENLVVT